MSVTKDEPTAEKVTLEIKLPQLLAGVVASLATAVLGSRLGLNGTLIGAAFSSLAMGLLSPFVTFGLLRSHQGLRTRAGRRVAAPAESAEPVDAPAVEVDADDLAPEVVETLPPAEVSRRLGPRAVVLGVLAMALVTFALTLGVLTVFEASAGRSVDGSQGTTVQGVTRPRPAASTTSAAPSASPSPTPTHTPTPTASTASPTPSVSSASETTGPAPTATTTSQSAAPTQPVVSATPAHATLPASPQPDASPSA